MTSALHASSWFQRKEKGVPSKVRSQPLLVSWEFAHLAYVRRPALLKSLVPFTC